MLLAFMPAQIRIVRQPERDMAAREVSWPSLTSTLGPDNFVLDLVGESFAKLFFCLPPRSARPQQSRRRPASPLCFTELRSALTTALATAGIARRRPVIARALTPSGLALGRHRVGFHLDRRDIVEREAWVVQERAGGE